MTTNEIAALAMTLGQRTEEEGERLSALCQGAQLELTAGLRPGLSPEDCGPAFSLAAACLALAALETGEAESFTAGDLTIRTGEGAARSRELRRQAMALMAPYLTDAGFAFRGVRG
jgi:hypothetical protein